MAEMRAALTHTVATSCQERGGCIGQQPNKGGSPRAKLWLTLAEAFLPAPNGEPEPPD